MLPPRPTCEFRGHQPVQLPLLGAEGVLVAALVFSNCTLSGLSVHVHGDSGDRWVRRSLLLWLRTQVWIMRTRCVQHEPVFGSWNGLWQWGEEERGGKCG